MSKDRHILSVEEPASSSVQNSSPESTKKWEEQEKLEIESTRYRTNSNTKTDLTEFKDRREIKSGKKGNIKGNVHFKHSIATANRTINGKDVLHFIKKIDERSPARLNEVEAKIEVMSLRYARMGDLAQPAAYYSFDEAKQEHLVISVGVEKFKAFADIPGEVICDNILQGRYKGAGGKFFQRWAFDDYDFNTSNVGKDENGNIIILDAGWYLGSRFRKYQSKITEYDFNHFPMVEDFLPDYFLDHIMTDKKRQKDGTKNYEKIIGKGSILSPAMIHNAQFRREFFGGALQFLVLPDEFNLRFAKAHIVSDSSYMVGCGQEIDINESYSNHILYADEYYVELKKSKLKDIQSKMLKEPASAWRIPFLHDKASANIDKEIDVKSACANIDKEIYAMREPNFMEEAEAIGLRVINQKIKILNVALESVEYRHYLRLKPSRQAFEHYIDTMKKYAEIDNDLLFEYVPDLEQSMRARYQTLQLCRQYKQIICTKLVSLGDRHQPNTRFSLDGTKIEVANIDELTLFSELSPADIQRNVLSGSYRGLGNKLFWKWALDDDDFDLNSIGVDKDGRVQLVEAGTYLGRLTRVYLNKMTLRDFEHFPLLTDYKSLRFLDLFKAADAKNPDGKILTDKLMCDDRLRREFFAAALQFMLMPDAYIRLMTHHVIMVTAVEMHVHLGFPLDEAKEKIKATKVAEELLLRREQTRTVAMQFPKFVQYLKSPAAKEDFEAYLAEIRIFGEKDETLSAVANFEERVTESFNRLRLEQVKQENILQDYRLSPEIRVQSKIFHARHNPQQKQFFQPLTNKKLKAIDEEFDSPEDEWEAFWGLIDAQDAIDRPQQQNNAADHPQAHEEVQVINNQFVQPTVSVPSPRKNPSVSTEKPADDFEWLPIAIGVTAAFAITSLILSVSLFFGVTIVATLSSHALLSVVLGGTLALIGGVVGYLVSQPIEETKMDGTMATSVTPIIDVLILPDEATVDATLRSSPKNAVVDLLADTPNLPLPENVPSPQTKDKQGVEPENFNPALAPFYREGTSKQTIDLKLVEPEMTGSVNHLENAVIFLTHQGSALSGNSKDNSPENNKDKKNQGKKENKNEGEVVSQRSPQRIGIC